MRRLPLVLAALAAGAAVAQAAEPDLSVHSVPAGQRAPSLRIRKHERRHVAQAAAPQGAIAPASAPSGGPAEQPEGQGGVRDLEERVVFKFAGGLAVDASPTSGQAMRNGVKPADLPGDIATGVQPLRTSNSYLMGDAVLGSRGMPTPALNAYFSSQFRLGIDGVSAYATRNDVWDSQNDNDILIQSAYAEIDDWGKEGESLHPLFVRAGRQFHYGSALFATQFDGLQLGWEKPDWEIGGFVGQRVALYQGDSPGVVAGASARVRLERMVGWPLALLLDAMSFDGDRTYLETGARISAGGARVFLSARALDNGDGDGFGIGRLSARARVPFGDKLLVQADGDVILSSEVAYDYLSPNPVDVINLSSSGIALALPEPGDSVRVGGGIDYALFGGLEAYGFGRASFASKTGFDSSWIELGAALEAQMHSGLAAGAQFKLRAHILNEDANAFGQPFEDMSGSGVNGFREASAELRYRRGYRSFGISAGGWLRVYDVIAPYATVKDDARTGGRVDADYWVDKHARVHVIAEAAQPSKAWAAELDTQYSVRFLGEASF